MEHTYGVGVLKIALRSFRGEREDTHSCLEAAELESQIS
jgi:hypothetical protein